MFISKHQRAERIVLSKSSAKLVISLKLSSVKFFRLHDKKQNNNWCQLDMNVDFSASPSSTKCRKRIAFVPTHFHHKSKTAFKQLH